MFQFFVFALCIVICLCNINQRNAHFSKLILWFSFSNFGVFCAFRTSWFRP